MGHYVHQYRYKFNEPLLTFTEIQNEILMEIEYW